MSDLNPFPWCSECASWHAPGHHLPDVSSDLAGQLRAKNAEVHTLLLKLDEYEHRAKLHMDRCQHDMERIVALEQQNEALASRLGRLRSILGQYDRDEIDDGDAFVAMCAVLEEAAVETPETHTSPVVSPETAGEHTQWGDHPEMWCGDCGRPNAVWFAPNALWNQVMGSPNGIICPSCFAIRADNAGVSGVWKFDLHDALVVERHVTNEETQ